MNVLIIEDEKPTALRLKNLLLEIDSSIRIVGTIGSVQSGISWYRSNPMPDLVFQDIFLNDGNCFEIFETVEITAPVIFTTAFSEYAIQSFQVNSIDYIVKPYDINDLRAALKKYNKLKGVFQPPDDILLEEILKSRTPVPKKRFLVKRGPHFLSVESKDIAYLYSEDGITFATLFTKEKYIVNHSIGDLALQMNPEMFYRINRKMIVNIQGVHKISSWFHNRLHLSLSPEYDDKVIVSRDRVSGFKEWLDL